MESHRNLVMAKKREMVLLSIFRTLNPDKKSIRFCRYSHVAKFLNMSYNKVYHIC